jgi:50S ribosomal protein L16 3-hydroxylase
MTASAHSVFTHLGRLPVAEFMRRYWQRRPLLIRNALAGFASPVTLAELFALARREGVESRLVTSFGGRWRLQHGPLERLPAARRDWTVLVQNVEAHLPAAAALLARFRFIADARLDDLMVSYAVAGGGVGPHVDSYDVFLIQAQGRRRWRISRQRNLDEQPGLPLKVLADFRPTQEWVLAPGDMLYLPPQVAHEGTAVDGDCITCSVGFRTPALAQIAEHWFDALSARTAQAAPWRDPGLRPTRQPARLPPGIVQWLDRELHRLQPRRADAARALLAALSLPKQDVCFEPRRRTRDLAARLRRDGVRLDPRTRLLYLERRFGINGEVVEPPRSARLVLRALADGRALDRAACTALPSAAEDLLLDWLHAGWLHLHPTRGKR